jgi:hypothetical protein
VCCVQDKNIINGIMIKITKKGAGKRGKGGEGTYHIYRRQSHSSWLTRPLQLPEGSRLSHFEETEARWKVVLSLIYAKSVVN